MSDLPTIQPNVTPDTEEFWEATTEGRLLIGHCNDCDDHYYYPRRRCPNCFSTDTEYVESSGEGEVYARSITRQNGGPWADVTPYVLAYVELEEGPRVLTNVVDADPDDVEVGDEVEVVFDEASEGASLPRFRPV